MANLNNPKSAPDIYCLKFPAADPQIKASGGNWFGI